MKSYIDKTALIARSAQLGTNVTVGPFCTIGENVTIGNYVRLHSHVVIDGHTTIGDGCEIFPFAVLGAPPQHARYNNEPSELIIGKKCIIREHVTMHPGTAIDAMKLLLAIMVCFSLGRMLRMIVSLVKMLFLQIILPSAVM